MTDADLILGYLNPDYFLGGKMRLNQEAAEEAIRERVAKPLGIDVLKAAWGIHEVVCENMAIASRIHTLERGRDPRSYVMLAIGGAGPVHAVRVAQKLGLQRITMPASAGVFSALGMLVAPLSFDYIHTWYMVLEEADEEVGRSIFQKMEEEGIRQLTNFGILRDQIAIQRSAEMRYCGQGHEIKVFLPGGTVDREWIQKARQAFDEAYRTIYHRTLEGIPVEVVNWRSVVSSPMSGIPREALVPRFSNPNVGPKGYRPVFFPDPQERIPCPVYERYHLLPGTRLEGPAIIEELESTAIIHPGDRVEIDDAGNLIVIMKKR